MYNSVGYFDNEYYRFGVVFIYQNGTLSNVYNTIGTTLPNSTLQVPSLFNNSTRQYLQSDDNGWIKNIANANSKGVCHIKANVTNDKTIIGINFNIPDEVKTYLKTLGIRGLFFVR